MDGETNTPQPVETDDERENRLRREAIGLLKQARDRLFDLSLRYGATGRWAEQLEATRYSLAIANIIGSPANAEAARDCKSMFVLNSFLGRQEEAERVKELGKMLEAAAVAQLKARADAARADGKLEAAELYEQQAAELTAG